MSKAFNTYKHQWLRTSQELTWIRFAATATAGPINIISKSALAAAKPFKEVPGFKNLPFFGTSWVFLPLIGKYDLKQALKYDVEKYKKFGPISRDTFGNLNLVSIHDPNDLEAIFRNESQYPSRGDLTTLRTYREMRKDWFSTTGIIVLNGKKWYDLRLKLQKSLLKTTIVDRYVEPMHQVAQDLIRHMRHTRDSNNEVPDLLGQLLKWALESVTLAGLNTRFGCLNDPPTKEGMKMIESAQAVFTLMNELEAFTGNIQWWKWFSTPTWRKFVRNMDYFSQTAFKYANQTLEEIQKKGRSNDDELTMIESMLATKGLDLGGTVTMIVDMLMAGVDTTSHTVGFFLYAMSKNPEKQEKMHQEILKFLPNPTDRITPEVLMKMSYLKYCIKESQRLYPIVRGLARTLEEEMVLSGYRIPPGVSVIYPYYVSPREEEYFKNAREFIPERWMDEDNKPHPFAFLPFGLGARSCIGRRLAEVEVQCLAIEIIRNFKLEYHYEDIGMISRLIIAPDRPFRITFRDRTSKGLNVIKDGMS